MPSAELTDRNPVISHQRAWKDVDFISGLHQATAGGDSPWANPVQHPHLDAPPGEGGRPLFHG